MKANSMAEALLSREAAVDIAEAVNTEYGHSWTPEDVIDVANRYYDEGVDDSPAEAVDCIAHHDYLVSQNPDG